MSLEVADELAEEALKLPSLSKYSDMPVKRLRKDNMATLSATHEHPRIALDPFYEQVPKR